MTGWEGGSRGRGHMHVYFWLNHADAWQKSTQNCKAISFQLKTNTFFKRQPTEKIHSYNNAHYFKFHFN